MKLQPRLKGSVKGLVEELMVSFPIDLYEAQGLLTIALQRPEVIKMVRSSIELHQMEVECQGVISEPLKMEGLC